MLERVYCKSFVCGSAVFLVTSSLISRASCSLSSFAFYFLRWSSCATSRWYRLSLILMSYWRVLIVIRNYFSVTPSLISLSLSNRWISEFLSFYNNSCSFLDLLNSISSVRYLSFSMRMISSWFLFSSKIFLISCSQPLKLDYKYLIFSFKWVFVVRLFSRSNSSKRIFSR